MMIMVMMVIIMAPEGQTLISSFLVHVCKATGLKEEGQPWAYLGDLGFKSTLFQDEITLCHELMHL